MPRNMKLYTLIDIIIQMQFGEFDNTKTFLKLLTVLIKTQPPGRFELPTPGLQDQCSATEL